MGVDLNELVQSHVSRLVSVRCMKIGRRETLDEVGLHLVAHERSCDVDNFVKGQRARLVLKRGEAALLSLLFFPYLHYLIKLVEHIVRLCSLAFGKLPLAPVDARRMHLLHLLLCCLGFQER